MTYSSFLEPDPVDVATTFYPPDDAVPIDADPFAVVGGAVVDVVSGAGDLSDADDADGDDDDDGDPDDDLDVLVAVIDVGPGGGLFIVIFEMKSIKAHVEEAHNNECPKFDCKTQE